MSEVTTQHTSDWQPTACNLCYANCGILVKTGGPDGRSIIKVKGAVSYTHLTLPTKRIV